MDRIEAMRIFVTTLDEASLAGAGRKLGKSPAAVSRAIASLEEHVGTELLHRTTRSIRLSAAGERYASACRRILADIDEAERLAADESSAPRGTLTITAPVVAGETILRPIIREYMARFPDVTVRLYLLDRPANLIDEGIDVALRIAHLADSSMIGMRIGEIRRVIVGSPSYLREAPPLTTPSDLSAHQIVAMTHFGIDSWSFPPLRGSNIPRAVNFTPRYVVNSVRAAVQAAQDGCGLTRLFSYHVADHVRDGTLCLLLEEDEHPPIPVHLLTPQGRNQIPKVRAFLDMAAPPLRQFFAGNLQR